MYHSQLMYFVVARFFEDHSVDDRFPPIERIIMQDAIVDDRDNRFDDEHLLVCVVIFWCVGFKRVGLDVC